MMLISDDVLDSFEHGWTPELVRRLVTSYRELKRHVEEPQTSAADQRRAALLTELESRYCIDSDYEHGLQHPVAAAMQRLENAATAPRATQLGGDAE